MMRRTVLAPLALLVLITPVVCAQTTGNRSTEDFGKFWADFRAAALANDLDRVVAMTQIPFRTKGLLDEDPEGIYDAAGFRKLWPDLLEQDPGLSPEPETMARFIERKRELGTQDLEPGGSRARVGQFVFEKVGAKWLFTQAYVEE